MAFVRTIFAALIAISVAMVPATGGAAISTKPVEMSMADQADMPCCPLPMTAKVPLRARSNASILSPRCSPLQVSLPHVADGPPPSFADVTLHGHVSPPTHPPPI